MALEFRLRDFCDPLRVLRVKRRFERNQRLTAEALAEHGRRKLRAILLHALETVPFYRKQGIAADLSPDLAPDQLLEAFPVLTKGTLREALPELASDGFTGARWSVSTSGSTGEPLSVLMDRDANALEFVHYWRHWSWHGYRLGDRFAEFSTVAFLNQPPERTFRHTRLTRRLLLNSLVLDGPRVQSMVGTLQEFKPKFLKGLASVLYLTSKIGGSRSARLPSLQTVFSTGETLTPAMRRSIEDFFGCPVRDSYGLIERVAAVSECEMGSLHLMTDYGHAEFLPADAGRFRLVATGLHNRVMPLVRYDTGDILRGPPRTDECVCGRPFPTVTGIAGREASRTIKLRQERWMPAPFVLVDGLRGVESLQMIQEKEGELLVLVAPQSWDADHLNGISADLEARLAGRVDFHLRFAGPSEFSRDSVSGKTPLFISRLES